jgi:hypothetical protein
MRVRKTGQALLVVGALAAWVGATAWAAATHPRDGHFVLGVFAACATAFFLGVFVAVALGRPRGGVLRLELSLTALATCLGLAILWQGALEVGHPELTAKITRWVVVAWAIVTPAILWHAYRQRRHRPLVEQSDLALHRGPIVSGPPRKRRSWRARRAGGRGG